MKKSDFKLKKIAVLCALTVFSFVVFGACKNMKRADYSTYRQTFCVVIDAGHGGIDGGVTGRTSGVRESDLNLEIANLLKSRFEESGFKTVMTRTNTGGLYGTLGKGFKKRDMQKRKEIIEKSDPDIMISVHLNHFSSPTKSGAQVFFKIDGAKDKKFAECVQRSLNGLSSQKRELSPLCGDYFVLNVSPCPAVICECGFLSNEQDEKMLLTETYRKEIAERIFIGAMEYLLKV